MWEVEYTDEFGAWWDRCDEPVQEDVAICVNQLMINGPNLNYPHCSGISG